MAATGIWTGDEPLILASRSETRQALLASIGIDAEQMAADLDERAAEAEERSRGATPVTLARRLAAAKACAVSRRVPERWVLGADQILAFEDRPLNKSPDLGAAAERLRLLAGRSHRLISACALARGGSLLFEGIDTAELTMRTLRPGEVALYLRLVGPQVLASVGAYRVEGIGRALFERVEGDHATILGLPLSSLLRYLRDAGLTSL